MHPTSFGRARRGMLRQTVRGAAGCALAAIGLPAAARAPFPSRPLSLIVPQSAGGTGDAVSRLVAQKLGQRLGQQVMVENKPGAGGTLGTALVVKAPADGHTLVLASTGYATWPTMYPRMPFNPATDLAPVGMMGSLPFAFLVRGDAPYRTAADFAAHARTLREPMTYASAGLGAMSHLLAAWFQAEAGLDLRHIPYSGTAPALTALLGGQVDLYFDPVATSAELVKAGKVKALATTGAQRSNVMPQTPTLAETGYPVRGTVWLGLMTAAGTPQPAIERLNRELRAVIEDEDVRAQLRSRGVDPEAMTARAFGEFLSAEVRTWGKLVRDAGIKAE